MEYHVMNIMTEVVFAEILGDQKKFTISIFMGGVTSTSWGGLQKRYKAQFPPDPRALEYKMVRCQICQES